PMVGCSPLKRRDLEERVVPQFLPALGEKKMPRAQSPIWERWNVDEAFMVPSLQNAAHALASIAVEEDEESIWENGIEKCHSQRILWRLLEHADRSQPFGTRKLKVATPQAVADFSNEACSDSSSGFVVHVFIRQSM